MSKLKEILSGYQNYFISSKVVEEKAKERAFICSGCPLAKKGMHSALLVDMKITEVNGMYCGECGCPLSAKVRSETTSCPLKKW